MSFPWVSYAVVTSDLQVAAANKHEARRRAIEEFLPKQIAFLNQARRLAIPVIHLQLVVPVNDPRNEGLPPELQFSHGSKGSQILPEVRCATDVVVPKARDSGFAETILEPTLRSLEVNTLILTGMQTQVCIQTTAADAHFRGYQVIVPSDCVTSTRKEDTDRALEWMSKWCAKVLTSQQVLELIEREVK